MRRKNRDIFSDTGFPAAAAAAALFEVVYVNANRVIGNPGLSIIVLSLVMNFLVLPLYMRPTRCRKRSATWRPACTAA